MPARSGLAAYFLTELYSYKNKWKQFLSLSLSLVSPILSLVIVNSILKIFYLKLGDANVVPIMLYQVALPKTKLLYLRLVN